MVLLHGLGGTGALNWDPIIEVLAGRFRVVALDHRGHGRGIRPDERFTLEDCADDVAALLGVLGVRRAVLVGYSMGGAIAQLTWRRHRRLVAGLVLLATGARFDIPPGSELVTWLMAEVSRHNDELPIAGHSARAIHHAVGALGGFDARPWLGHRYVPAMVLLTTRDRVVSPRLQQELAEAVARGRTRELAAGHLVAVLDRRGTAEALGAACHQMAVESGLGGGRRERLVWWGRRVRHRVGAWRRRRLAGPSAGT